MADKTIITTGATVTFGTSGFTVYLDSFSVGGTGREAIDTSHMGTTGSRTFSPGKLFDEGTLTLNGHCNPDNTPPKTGAAETITITWPLEEGESTAAEWEAECFVTAYDFDAPMEDKATVSVQLKVSGSWTVTPAT